MPPGMTAGEAPVATAAQRASQVRGGGGTGGRGLSLPGGAVLRRRCRAARCGREGLGLNEWTFTVEAHATDAMCPSCIPTPISGCGA